MLEQCGKLQDRFAILDVKNGEKDITESPADLTAVRSAFGENLMYGAAYYPWVVTRINHWVDPNGDEGRVTVKVGTSADKTLGELRGSRTVIYNAVKAELANHYVTLPSGAALAGVYSATDTKRGVWKSPANVTLANVLKPVVPITNEQQGELNHDPATGKSINVLRAFAGRGTVVWGARTLAGNDNEWRYISVRRFFNMVEESVKKSTAWAVFENNDANTWTKVRGMIEAYLTQKWREGALAGATTRDAFFVRCGLGTTMNSQDILEGRMNVEIGMAVVRPAEFIVLKFTHKLQTS
jgi:phage tail sheath protein FI